MKGKRTVMCVLIAIAFLLPNSFMLFSVSQSASGLPARVLDTTPARDLWNFTFQNYNLGDDPSQTVPQEFFRGTDYGLTPGVVQNTTFNVTTQNGTKQLEFKKTSATTDPQSYILPLVDQYFAYNLSMDLLCKDTQQTGTGLGFQFFGGSYATGNYVGAGDWAMVYLSGQLRFRMHYSVPNYTQYNNLYENTSYRLSIQVDVRFQTINTTLYNRATGADLGTFAMSFYNNTGGVKARNLTFMQFTYTAAETKGDFFIDNITASVPAAYSDPRPNGGNWKPFIFMLDDAEVSQFTDIYPILETYHLVATTSLIVNSIGLPGYMTWGNLNTLWMAGWQIASHSLSHPHLTSISLVAAEYEILKSKQWIEANMTDYTVTQIIAPYNNWNTTLDAYARSVGYLYTPFNFNRFSYYAGGTNATIDTYLNVWGKYGTQTSLYSHDLNGTPSYGMYSWQLFRLINETANRSMSWTTTDISWFYESGTILNPPYSRFGPIIGPLVNLIFVMFAIGIVVGVVAEGTNSLRKMRMRTSQQMVKSLLNMVIYIVIGMASLGVLYSVMA